MEYTVNRLRDFTLSHPPLPNHYSGFCFGCVKRNEAGLKLQFWFIEGKVFTIYNIPPKYSGFQGLGPASFLLTQPKQKPE
ncbi:MAG: hypothetical protein ACFFFB_18325 [Candidatus Heimdallarchaeota archaeon]